MSISDFPGSTRGNVPVVNVLKGAEDLAMVVVLGYRRDGTEYFASSTGDAPECAFLCQRYVKYLLEECEGDY
jgi:hypothetical protein